MQNSHPTTTQKIARAASEFQRGLTGEAPRSVTVHDEQTLVITLHGTLTPDEQALVASPVGAAKVEEFHRRLFAGSADSLRDEIRRITGLEVSEVEGVMMRVLPDGRTVQVLMLNKVVSFETWESIDDAQ